MDVPDVCLEWRNLAFGVSKKFVEHTLNRAPCIIGAGIAHVIMLESGVDDRDSRFVGLLFAREHAWIGLELRIVGAERQDLELAMLDEWYTQIVPPFPCRGG